LKLFKFLSKRKQKRDLVRVLSHPRSGTQFLANFIGVHFYPDTDLSIVEAPWGHWSDRKTLKNTLKYGQLFQSHAFPVKPFLERMRGKKFVYIYRDGRAVASSVWKTDGFFTKENENISFSDFIDFKIDWSASPGRKVDPEFTIAEHWYAHVDAWFQEAKKNENILIVRYEDLIDSPQSVFNAINAKYFNSTLRFSPKSEAMKKIGILPNSATKDSWKTVFSPQDESKFLSYLKDEKYLSEF